MQASTRDIKKELSCLNKQIQGTEEKLNAMEQREIIHREDYLALERKMIEMENKPMDAEDRSRRKNLRIRGIPEQVTTKNLEPYIEDFIKHLDVEWDFRIPTIERCHKVNKPRGVPDLPPRDVMLRCTSFKLNTQIMSALRSKKCAQEYETLKVFQDLSWSTTQKRKTFADSTIILRNNNIKYRWGSP
ncbi:Hypothetical predicted protein [Pelobates cultripes]|uniref:Uncharacterized protein n=1 Tax=Pelobates cultripes TaxID=61616 RepID=A0AAD1WU47_PELCU|nr:Hypothetical predicted protein [Pelobates cultripes]